MSHGLRLCETVLGDLEDDRESSKRVDVVRHINQDVFEPEQSMPDASSSWHSTLSPNMSASSYSVLTEQEVREAPMYPHDKDLVIRHLQRLKKHTHAQDSDCLPAYTSKETAREQLARMTLVVREYARRKQDGSFTDRYRDDLEAEMASGSSRQPSGEIESMIQDVIEASFEVHGKKSTFEKQGMFSGGCAILGKDQAERDHSEQAIAAIAQDDLNDAGDDITELWNAPNIYQPPLPEPKPEDDIAHGIDWAFVLGRSRSCADRRNFRRWVPDMKLVKLEQKVGQVMLTDWQVAKPYAWDRGNTEQTLQQTRGYFIDRNWPPPFRAEPPTDFNERKWCEIWESVRRKRVVEYEWDGNLVDDEGDDAVDMSRCRWDLSEAGAVSTHPGSWFKRWSPNRLRHYIWSEICATRP